MSGAVDHDRALTGRYALERELGRGGMGVVFLARDLRHDRNVAIKFLPGELASAVGAARFDREIRTLARLSHPHVLPLHDSGEANGELFYVMPYVEGESLRQRLERDGPMRVPEALRILRQVADALAYAHARGIVHRDIKPENVLLDRHGHAYVADFGIARVLQATDDDARLTSATVRVGSVAYMSPEQLAGEADVDGRSDIYSLGCVLFEMLAGEPPFTHRSAQVVMRRHLIDPPPGLRERRADVSVGLDELARAMLAKDPAERIATAEALGAALEHEAATLTASGTAPRLLAPRTRVRPRTVVAALAVLAIAAWGLTLLRPEPQLDASRIAMLPVDWSGAAIAPAEGALDVLLREAFRRWSGIDVVEPSANDRATTAAAGLRLARRLDAGRYVHGAAAPLADSIRLTLTLHDAASGSPLRSVSLRIPAAAGTAASVRVLVDSLLFGRVTLGAAPATDIGTRSYHARLDYGEAHRALEHWDLVAADSLFASSTEHDGAFARAHLWLAQTRSWAARPADLWRDAAERAAAAPSRLESREATLAAALAALGAGDFPLACDAYDGLVRADSLDFAGWFGSGECRRMDVLVLRDPATPSGWRFRSSYHSAARAYMHAFLAAPLSARMLRPRGFERARYLFYTYGRMRPGRDASGNEFLAHAAARGDTLVLDPYPWTADGDIPEPSVDAFDRAMRLQRQQLRRVVLGWVAASPRSSDALLALAVSMETLADPAAVETVRRSRVLARSEAEQLELALREVWLRVRFGAPRLDELSAARALADSILMQARDGADVEMAALAVLVGRPARGAQHARRELRADDPLGLPAAVLRPAAALAIFAAVGGPADSLAALERQVETGIRNGVPDAQRAQARRMFLEREAFLAWPAHRFALLSGGDVASPTARAYAFWLRDDGASAHSLLEESALLRSGTTAGALSMDVAYAEAALYAALGDTAAALSLLASALDNLQWMQPGELEQPARAGALVRGMALRARLARASGDSALAETWSRAVATLWSGGEQSALDLVEDVTVVRPRSAP